MTGIRGESQNVKLFLNENVTRWPRHTAVIQPDNKSFKGTLGHLKKEEKCLQCEE